ncbi:MAG: ACP S-malonyltransferase [Pseudomonadota bacterium]
MRFAAVFPGQGSQSTSMLSELAEAHGVIEKTFAEASAVLGRDLWALVRDNPDSALDQTVNTQPAMLAAGVACWRLWREQGGAPPAVMAGHSLGEYSALVAAGAIDFVDAVAIVARRAELMQSAVPAGEGAMAAVLGLEDEEVIKLCRERSEENGVVEAVNFNAPGQVVIAGHRGAVEAAVEPLKEAGAKRVVVLPVSVPSHSSLMRGAAEALGEFMQGFEIRTPAIPVLHNVDGQTRDSAEGIRHALVAQLHQPVQWVDTVRGLESEALVEMGPGKVLAGLAKRIARGAPVGYIDSLDSLAKALDLVGAVE